MIGEMVLRGEDGYKAYHSQIGLLLWALVLQTGDCRCIYNFDGIQNGITIGLNIDYTDTVFKFTIVNQTEHIMSNKHAKMITEHSDYYYVSGDYLKTRKCPYPGLVEDIHIGIEDEITCNVTVTVTVEPAILELAIPEEISVKIVGELQEPEIYVYQLHLNATKQCASYTCIIECKNEEKQYFLISAGPSEARKSLLDVWTSPRSIQYSPFQYQLLFTCYDINYYFDTQVTAISNFTFIDISVTSSTERTATPNFHPSGTTFPTKYLIKTETVKQSSSRNDVPSYTTSILPTLVSFTPITSSGILATATNNLHTGSPSTPKPPKLSRSSTIYSTDVLTSTSESVAGVYSEYTTSKLISSSSIAFGFSYTTKSETSMQTFTEATVLSIFTKTSNSYLTAISPTQPVYISSGSFIDKATNVAALSTVAGVVAVVAVGIGVYVLTSKRPNTVGDRNENKESEETKNTDTTEDRVTAQHEILHMNKRTGQN